VLATELSTTCLCSTQSWGLENSTPPQNEARASAVNEVESRQGIASNRDTPAAAGLALANMLREAGNADAAQN